MTVLKSAISCSFVTSGTSDSPDTFCVLIAYSSIKCRCSKANLSLACLTINTLAPSFIFIGQFPCAVCVRAHDASHCRRSSVSQAMQPERTTSSNRIGSLSVPALNNRTSAPSTPARRAWCRAPTPAPSRNRRRGCCAPGRDCLRNTPHARGSARVRPARRR